MPDRYFELLDHVGLDPEGNHEPLVEIGVSVIVPTMRDGQVVGITEGITLKPIPGTRVVKVDDPRIIPGLLETGLLKECDPPNRAELKKLRDETTDAREKAGTHVTPEEAAAAETPKEG